MGGQVRLIFKYSPLYATSWVGNAEYSCGGKVNPKHLYLRNALFSSRHVGIGGLLFWLGSVNNQLNTQRATSIAPVIVHDTLVQIHEKATHDTVHMVQSTVHRDTLYILYQMASTNGRVEPPVPASGNSKRPVELHVNQSGLSAGSTIFGFEGIFASD